MRKILGTILCAILALITFGLSNAKAAETPQFRINFTVQISDSVSVDMGAIVLINPNKTKNGSTILVLNGIGQTANTFVPFAESVFADKTAGKKVARFVLLNYPGHGNSSLPIGAKFGDLSLGDYVTSLIESLKVLDAIDIKPDFALGHSLGAEMLHIAQDRLINEGTSLRKAFGIKGAFFVAPDIVGPSPWGFVESGGAAGIAASLTVQDPNLGTVVEFPAPVWIALFFGDLKGNVPAAAPTPDEAVAKGFISNDSALMAASFLAIGMNRPNVAEGIFAPSQGTVAGLVSLQQDPIYTQAEHKALYVYLTKDQNATFFSVIEGADTVHNMHLINTAPLIQMLTKVLSKASK